MNEIGQYLHLAITISICTIVLNAYILDSKEYQLLKLGQSSV